jgi:branched-chain amino acid transport system permease protein
MAVAGIVVVAALVAIPLFGNELPYATVLLVDLFVAALFAASLHFMMGPGGMVSFGHAAYFGLGAYGAGLLVRHAGLPMEIALVAGPVVAVAAAMLFGAFAVRLSGVYLAMLTLAFAQIVWSVVFQWEDFTGGSNGLVGVWPAPWLAAGAAYYYLALTVTVAGLWTMRRMLHSPFGYAMRAARDSSLRADSIGIDVARVQWVVIMVAAGAGGLAGAVYAFSKGSISPDVLSIARSVDALVMVLLGGVQTVVGPVVGASVFTWLQDSLARETEYWRALLGASILALVLLFPSGIAGAIRERFRPEGVER